MYLLVLMALFSILNHSKFLNKTQNVSGQKYKYFSDLNERINIKTAGFVFLAICIKLFLL